MLGNLKQSGHKTKRASLLYGKTDAVIDELTMDLSPVREQQVEAEVKPAKAEQKQSTPSCSAPSGAPPPPAPPMPPPPPPMLGMQATKAALPKSVSTLQSMQSRLRRRMSKAVGVDQHDSEAKKVDPKVRLL